MTRADKVWLIGELRDVEDQLSHARHNWLILSRLEQAAIRNVERKVFGVRQRIEAEPTISD